MTPTTNDRPDARDDGATADSDADREPEPYDHYRPVPNRLDDDAIDVEQGVYRVVGTGETVALLQVGDAEGRRVNTGRVVTVDDDLARFERAPNPDGNRSAADSVAGALDSLVWQVRAFGQGLRRRPVASLVAVALVVGGNLWEEGIPGPDWVPSVVVVVGALALAYIGSRNG